MIKLTLAAILVATALYAQTGDGVELAHRSEYMRAACDGKVNAKGQCTVCLGSGDAGITDLAEAIPGSFTAPAPQKEVLLITSSTDCESHANNFGGAILIKFHNGAWEHGPYKAGITGTDLKVIRTPAGRDLLVFQAGFVQAGEVDSWIGVLTLSMGGFDDQTLLRVSDPGGTQCDAKGQVMNQGEIKKVEVAGGAIHAHVQVITSRQKGDKDGGCVAVPGSTPAKAQYDLEYVLRGEKFVVAPASAAAAQTLKALFER